MLKNGDDIIEDIVLMYLQCKVPTVMVTRQEYVLSNLLPAFHNIAVMDIVRIILTTLDGVSILGVTKEE